MYILTTKPRTMFNDSTNEFIDVPGYELHLEHSLISVSKWERATHKSFFREEALSRAETVEYIKCMTLNPPKNPLVYTAITNTDIAKVQRYIDDPMTATTVRDNNNGGHSNEGVTSELIYYWMIANNIPVEFEKWHLNRLLMLIKVCAIKNSPSKKMSMDETIRHNRALNAARRKAKKK